MLILCFTLSQFKEWNRIPVPCFTLSLFQEWNRIPVLCFTLSQFQEWNRIPVLCFTLSLFKEWNRIPILCFTLSQFKEWNRIPSLCFTLSQFKEWLVCQVVCGVAALDDSGNLTSPLGLQMVEFPLSPCFAKMLLVSGQCLQGTRAVQGPSFENTIIRYFASDLQAYCQEESGV